ncbi:hypothetical protein G6321_00053300 [Bradyrhizobium barranii subsp. barranii]|uniref:Transmembrane protein n=1 Tax=Bradyrhizobium barranii subsp. barranii TaxID=2823807 RepID=A0A7Z0QB79_9BRAD|nr:hypothetical protein [Bradyrhizobium barranii]UGX94233.1 hypothetical protein G6321_00053300 [Bradyrhizobium barranii subsp. barranii]
MSEEQSHEGSVSQNADELKEREFDLKLIQAWAESRNRIAVAAAVLNGATLATVIATMKDKGNIEPYMSTLGFSIFGLAAGMVAVAFAWQFADSAMEKLMKREKAATAILVHWLVGLVFFLVIMASVGGFLLSASYFSGYMQASLELRMVPIEGEQKVQLCHGDLS